MQETIFTKNGNVLTIERIIRAPREKVWNAWTTPELFALWWGPKGWTTTVKHMEFKPGGYVLYGMKCEDESQGEWFGQESWGKSVYGEIDPIQKFTYIDYFCGNDGTVSEGMPVTNVTLTFEEVDGGTKISNVNVFESEAALNQVIEMGMEEGVRQTWDRLADTVEQ